MSLQKKSRNRWLWTGLVLVCVGVGVTALFRKLDSNDSRPTSNSAPQFESPKASPAPDATGTAPNLAATNQPGTEPEDRVVALVTEGNQLVAQGKYANAEHKYGEAAIGTETRAKESRLAHARQTDFAQSTSYPRQPPTTALRTPPDAYRTFVTAPD